MESTATHDNRAARPTGHDPCGGIPLMASRDAMTPRVFPPLPTHLAPGRSLGCSEGLTYNIECGLYRDHKKPMWVSMKLI
jgi:hypothetical protein